LRTCFVQAASIDSTTDSITQVDGGKTSLDVDGIFVRWPNFGR
jgi:hypothetical protein